MPKTFHLISIFPEVFESYFGVGVLGRAQKKGLIQIKCYDLRDFAHDKHRSVDDTPYGGGPGMVMKIEPIFDCVQKIKNDISQSIQSEKEIKKENPTKQGILQKNKKTKVILLSAKGKIFDQKKALQLSKLENVIIICGRYEGVDERVARHVADEEISIGKFVISGGELAAMVVVDAVSRMIPGVLGNPNSLASESFLSSKEMDYPVYTRPEVFRSWKVPKVLLTGNHEKIAKWRKDHQKKIN